MSRPAKASRDERGMSRSSAARKIPSCGLMNPTLREAEKRGLLGAQEERAPLKTWILTSPDSSRGRPITLKDTHMPSLREVKWHGANRLPQSTRSSLIGTTVGDMLRRRRRLP
eukprot:scaffold25536_cov40-Prasinocladus_malaysianus.AAC.1